MKARWINISVTFLVIIGTGQVLTTQALFYEAPPIVEQGSEAQAARALAKKTGCLECHSVDKHGMGPAYSKVAERYKDEAGARAKLIDTVKNGGKGNWAEVTSGAPMPAHSRVLTSAEVERLVDWVLSLNDTEVK